MGAAGLPCQRLAVATGLLLALGGCFAMRPSRGGGQVGAAPTTRPVNPADVAVPAGYQVEVVATGLNYPTAVAFDPQNRPYVVEAGYSYGESFLTPRVLRLEPDGSTTVIASGENGPWTGIVYHEGAFYIAEGGVSDGGAIVRVGMDGSLTPLVTNLPSVGDHHTNGPAVGPDGWLYFGVGSATNSGVVGVDNHKFGWLNRFPDFRDIPARDITLTGETFETPNPLTPDPDDRARTGAYLPFGTPGAEGQTVRGQVPCTGAVLRIPTTGGNVETVAWGLRNPFGLAFDDSGRLYVTENQYDVRGSRPVWGTGDLLWQIEPGTWYGWPDFFAGEPLWESDAFQAPGQPKPKRLLARHPNPPPRPVAKLPVHGSACGIDFSRSDAFGHRGDAFIAQFGDMSAAVGKVMAPVGYNVLRVDPGDGAIHVFATNRGPGSGPASRLGAGGLERPVNVRFDRTNQALYVVDFGILTLDGERSKPQPGTGVVWRIVKSSGSRR